MTTRNDYRFYSFVANLYLSPLQCGLQTAHAVSNMSRTDGYDPNDRIYEAWADHDKTIVICAALNHKGVLDANERFREFGKQLKLPTTIFFEDEESMNGMATACGIIVPSKYWDVTFVPATDVTGAAWLNGDEMSGQVWPVTSLTGEFISFLKSFRLA